MFNRSKYCTMRLIAYKKFLSELKDNVKNKINK